MTETIAKLDVELGLDSSEFESGIGQVESRLSQLGRGFQVVGAGLTAGVTLPLAGIATTGLMAAAGFDQALSQMQVVTGATDQQMKELEATAIRLGAETSFSAGQAASAMLELGKAGLTPVQVMGAIPGVLDLAAAGGLDLAEAAEIAANSMNAFGFEAKDIPSIANMLAAAANSSSVEVTDLSWAMKASASVFASNGQSLGTLTTALAILGNNALKGSDAGTSLKSMMLALVAPTDKAQATLDSLGVSVFDATGTTRNFADIVGDLSSVTKTMTDQQRNAALSTIFGSDAIRAANILLANYETQWGNVEGSLSQAGAAAAVSDARMSGLAGAIEYFKGSVESTLISAALPFTDMLGNLLRSVGDAISSFNQLSEGTRNLVIYLGLGAAAVGPLLIGIGTMMKLASLAGPALSLLGTIIGGLSWPILLLVGAVAGLYLAWQTNFGGIRDITMTYLQPVIDRFNEVVDAFRSGKTSLDGIFGELGAVFLGLNTDTYDTVEALQGFWTALTGQETDYFDFANAIFGIAESFVELRTRAGEVMETLRLVFDYLVASFETGDNKSAFGWVRKMPEEIRGPVLQAGLMVAGLGTIFQTVATWAQESWGKIPGVLDALRMKWDEVVPSLQSSWETVAGVLTSSWDTVRTWLETTIPTAVSSLKTRWDEVIGSLPTVVDSLKMKFDEAWLAIQGVWSSSLTMIGAGVESIKVWLGSDLPSTITSLQTKWEESLPLMTAAWEGLITSVSTGYTSLSTWLGTDLPSILTGLGTSWSETWTTIQTKFEEVWAALGPLISEVVEILAPAFDRVKEAIGTIPLSLDELSPKFQRLAEAVAGMWETIQPILVALGALVGAVFVVVASFSVNLFAAAIERLPGIVGPIIDQVSLTIETLSGVVGGMVDAILAISEGDWSSAWKSFELVVYKFKWFFTGTFTNIKSFLSSLFETMFDAVMSTLRDFGVDAEAKLTSIKSWWEGLWTSIKDTLQPVIDAIGSVKSAIGDFSSWIATVTLVNPFQPLLDAVGTVGEGINNLLPGGQETTQTPKTNATGSSNFSGGWTWVGERGRELVNLPRGSKIFSNDDSETLVGGSAIQVLIPSVVIQSDVDIHAFAYRVAMELDRWRR